MALTDTAIRKAKPKDKPYKVSDSGGLYLLVNPTGSKLWRVKYRLHGVERKLALGAYPAITLAEARAAREDAKKQLAHAVDPNTAKRQARIVASISAGNSFSAVAEELIAKREKEGVAAATLEKHRWLLRLLGAEFGRRPVADITPAELLHELKKQERRGRLETAKQVRAFASRVFRYAAATARAERDPAQMLLGALIQPTVKHFAAITDPREFGALLRAIEGYVGDPAVMHALKLTPHVFQRPGELRQMEWTEIDFAKAVWTLPAAKMKMRQPHAVPLSRQALAILEGMRRLSGNGKYVFPSVRTRARPISDNTINAALRRLGYTKEQMTAHGFRTSASSLLNESGKWNPDAIERALAHMVAGSSRADALAAEGWSVASYTFRKLNALAARKVLFVQHLKLESQILHDSGGRLAALLDSYMPKSAYDEELDANRRLGNLVASIGEGARAEAWAADLLYVTVRNFGVLSLASRNIHLYAYERILGALTDVAILAPDAAPKLQRLRFIKYLYRSGERVAPGRVLGVVRDALAVLPRDAFPDAVEVMPARAVLNFPAPGAGEAAYLILRDLEKRMIAAQALSGGKLVDPELAALERWVADPRVYANLSLSMSGRLRRKLAHIGREAMADPKGEAARRAQ